VRVRQAGDVPGAAWLARMSDEEMLRICRARRRNVYGHDWRLQGRDGQEAARVHSLSLCSPGACVRRCPPSRGAPNLYVKINFSLRGAVGMACDALPVAARWFRELGTGRQRTQSGGRECAWTTSWGTCASRRLPRPSHSRPHILKCALYSGFCLENILGH
jgi:hypothetical protein